jgi:hypothetical protein
MKDHDLTLMHLMVYMKSMLARLLKMDSIHFIWNGEDPIIQKWCSF